MITAATLVAAGIPSAQAQRFEAPLQSACARFAIDTPKRMAAFVAQCAHESRNFTALEEGLFYRSADRICKIFPSRVADLVAAQPLVGNPQALANCVYAGRNGNGDEASGDGFRFRGRGLIQLTGRANYERAADALARDYIADPDLVAAAEDACLTAGWFWNAGQLNALADADRFDAITRAVNGAAMAGAAERRALYELALKAFSPATPADAQRDVPPAVVERAMPPAAAREAVAVAQAAAKKTRARRAPAAEAAAKKPAAKKPAAKKPATKKAAAKKPAAEKAAVKKAAVKRAAAGKAATKKTGARKAGSKKSAPRKAAANRPTRKRAAAKRAASKRAAPKKGAPKKPAKAATRAAR